MIGMVYASIDCMINQRSRQMITREKMREIAKGCCKCGGSGEKQKYTKQGYWYDAIACDCVKSYLINNFSDCVDAIEHD